MKTTKIFSIVLLALSAVGIACLCVMSVVTPIKFEETRAEREVKVQENLLALRVAELEFKAQNGHFTADYDSLFTFLKTAPKKELMKKGSLSEKQLEAGLNEEKALAVINAAKKRVLANGATFDNDSLLYEAVWADKAVVEAGLQGFARDTIKVNMLESLYKGKYTEDDIANICVIPYSGGKKFEIEVNNTDYITSSGMVMPLFEIRAPFDSYLADQDQQELINLNDQELKLDHYQGLKVGDVNEPNNYAGNWE